MFSHSNFNIFFICFCSLRNHLHSDTSGATDQQEIILFGHKICMCPSFDPQVGTDPVKGNIRVVLLQYPVRREGIPLSQTYTIFWKSCNICQYRHCKLYQCQSKPQESCSLFPKWPRDWYCFFKWKIKILWKACKSNNIHIAPFRGVKTEPLRKLSDNIIGYYYCVVIPFKVDLGYS